MFDTIYDLTGDMKLNLSYFEIYNDKIYDLFDTKKRELSLREDRFGRFQVFGLRKVTVNSHASACKWLEEGLARRMISKTTMNVNSSRSHTIFQIELL